jgi:hypothetical protein
MACFDPATSLLAGVDTATLHVWLADAQAALVAFSTGRREVTVIVTGGGQHREVTYRNDPNGFAQLQEWIRLLQAQLGIIVNPRRRGRITYA